MFDILIKRCIVRAYSHSPSVSPRSFMLMLSFMSCSAEIVVSILWYIRSVLTDREKTTGGGGGESYGGAHKTLCRDAAGGRNERKQIIGDG